MSLLNIFDVSGSAMNAQSVRLNVTASKLANADSVAGSTAGAYRARHPVFATMLKQSGGTEDGSAASAGVRVLGVVESQQTPAKRYQPDHPMADSSGYVYSSNVNPIEEMTNMISASRSFQGNVEVMTTARDLLVKTLSLGH